MKTLHVAYSFLPDPCGGTEVYVQELASNLERSGIRAVVTAPGASTASYTHEGLRVRRFGVRQDTLSLSDLYGRGDAAAAAAFDAILEDERPDVVHQHALTAACSVQLVERAKQRGIPVVFTYHTPAVSCQRGSLLEHGTTVCDGRLDASRCAACSLELHGVGARTSRMLAHTPEVVGAMADRAGLSGGGWTAIRMRALTAHRLEALATLLSTVDRFVALAPWVRSLLRVNGVSDDRIVDCPHGLPIVSVRPALERRPASSRLRLVHLGRVDPLKGTALLLEALLGLPEAPIDLDIFSVVQDETDAATLEELRHRARGDRRIRLLPALPHAAVVERLAAYDVVAIPSQVMETGPLVVLEAFAAGVPVLGSALGGIADKVRDGVDGLLVAPHDSVDAWRAALRRLAAEPRIAGELARGVGPVRSSGDVAHEMAALYVELLASTGTPAILPHHGIAAASRP